MDRADVAIVGAGPGGCAAAAMLAAHDLDVVVIDEQHAAGGQIHRRPPQSFAVTPAQRGRDRSRPDHRIRWMLGTTAWGLFDVDAEVDEGPVVALARGGDVARVRARRLLLAPGAFDLPVAFPGWTLPGVMAAGGIQAFLKTRQLLPGRRFVLAGAHPLLLVIADQLLRTGAEIATVAFAQPAPTMAESVRSLAQLRGRWGGLMQLAGPLARLRHARVSIQFGAIIVAADGTREVHGAVLADIDERWRVRPGRHRRLECDTIAIGYGFVPSGELARQAGCEMRHDDPAGGWVVACDRWMQTSRPAIYAAGEITGIAGADQAACEGELAAIGILRDLGRISPEEAGRRSAAPRRRYARLLRFSSLVQRRFAVPREVRAALCHDDTVVCRCEEVTASALSRALADNRHITTADAAKLLTRVGMGPCQGRMCEPTVTQLIANATGRAPSAVGAFAARPPVKPIPLGALAALAAQARTWSP